MSPREHQSLRANGPSEARTGRTCPSLRWEGKGDFLLASPSPGDQSGVLIFCITHTTLAKWAQSTQHPSMWCHARARWYVCGIDPGDSLVPSPSPTSARMAQPGSRQPSWWEDFRTSAAGMSSNRPGRGSSTWQPFFKVRRGPCLGHQAPG